jgi:hypothetical protein
MLRNLLPPASVFRTGLAMAPHAPHKAEALLDTSPPTHRNMLDALDRSAFRKSVPVLAARVKASDTNKFLKSDALKR